MVETLVLDRYRYHHFCCFGKSLGGEKGGSHIMTVDVSVENHEYSRHLSFS